MHSPPSKDYSIRSSSHNRYRLVKSQQEIHYVSDLEETIETLKEYKLKLNSKKCIFGVLADKFFRFLVDQRVIEANPE